MTLMDKACYERGCICYDSQDQNGYVEVVAKTDDQRELDMALAECEQENRLLRARVDRMEREFALERQQLEDENREIYHLLGMAHLELRQHLEYGFNEKTTQSTLISIGRYAPKLREEMEKQTAKMSEGQKNHGTDT